MSTSHTRRFLATAAACLVGAAALVAAPADAAEENGVEYSETAQVGDCTVTFFAAAVFSDFYNLYATSVSVSCPEPRTAIATQAAVAATVVPMPTTFISGFRPARADACTNCSSLSSAATLWAEPLVDGCLSGEASAIVLPNSEPVRFSTRLCNNNEA